MPSTRAAEGSDSEPSRWNVSRYEVDGIRARTTSARTRKHGATVRITSGLALLLLGGSLGYGLSRFHPPAPSATGESLSREPVVLERRGGETSERRREPTVRVGYLGAPEKAGRTMWKRSYGVKVQDAVEGQQCTVFAELVVGNRIHAIDTASGVVGEGGSLSLDDEILDPHGIEGTDLRLRGVCE